MVSKNILIVDDEIHILELLRYNLENNGYNVYQAETGEDSLKIIEDNSIDLVVLDLMLPGIDGLQVLRNIREGSRNSKLPVILLTAKNEEFDTVLGLEMGADDYMAKPFSIRELLARIKAVFRRIEEKKEVKKESINVGDLKINMTNRTVKMKDDIITMSLKEYELLILLAKNRGRAFTREELLEKIWGYDYYGETRTVDVHIRYLRKKIEEDDKNPKYILTLRGVGYKFRE